MPEPHTRPFRFPRPRTAVPPELLDGRPQPTARIRAAGLDLRRLTSPEWTRMTRGVHLPAGLDPAETLTRIRAAAEVMPPGAALGGWAALHLQGVDDLDGWRGRPGDDGSRPLPVTICLSRPSGRIRKRDEPLFTLDRRTLPETDVVEVDGIRVTSVVRSCSDIACREGVEAGMVAADAAARFGVLRAVDLRAYVRRRPRTTGLVASRRAAQLMSERTRSTQESRLRYIWVEEAGLPEPLVNVAIYSRLDGALLGEGDLLDPDAALVGECDGQVHLSLEQRTYDHAREEGMEGANLVVARATSHDMRPGRRRHLAWRLRQRRAQGLARDRSRDRWVIAAPDSARHW